MYHLYCLLNITTVDLRLIWEESALSILIELLYNNKFCLKSVLIYGFRYLFYSEGLVFAWLVVNEIPRIPFRSYPEGISECRSSPKLMGSGIELILFWSIWKLACLKRWQISVSYLSPRSHVSRLQLLAKLLESIYFLSLFV